MGDTEQPVRVKVTAWNDVVLFADGKEIKLEKDEQIGAVQIMISDKRGAKSTTRTVNVLGSDWVVRVITKPCPADPGNRMLAISMAPLEHPFADGVAPHGLVGQTWDADDVAIDGNRDRGKVIAQMPAGQRQTYAQGEGAIIGELKDYRVNGLFGTDFKFNRFGVQEALPRDTSSLMGERHLGIKPSAFAGVDLGDDE